MGLKLELEEGTEVEVPKDVIKDLIEHNPNGEAIEECATGHWSHDWAVAVTGISDKEAEENPELKEARQQARRNVCRKLMSEL